MKLLREGRPVNGQLTTDHAASSYGQPVMVLDDGTAMGPGDIPARDIIEATPEEVRWMIGQTSVDRYRAMVEEVEALR